MVFDDVADLALDGIDAALSPGGAPMLHLAHVRGALIRGILGQQLDRVSLNHIAAFFWRLAQFHHLD
jgi:hypothetical protein